MFTPCAGDGEAKFWLEPEVELAYNYKLSRKQLREVEAIIDERYQELVDARRGHLAIIRNPARFPLKAKIG